MTDLRVHYLSVCIACNIEFQRHCEITGGSNQCPSCNMMAHHNYKSIYYMAAFWKFYNQVDFSEPLCTECPSYLKCLTIRTTWPDEQ